MTIEIKEIWGNPIITLCNEYNEAMQSSKVEVCKEIIKKLLELIKLREWRVSLRAAQSIQKIAKVNPEVIQGFAQLIINDYENGLYLDKDARETVIIALRWCFPYIDPIAKTSEIISSIKLNENT